MAALSRVAESVGSDQVRLLTDTMARELPEVLASNRGRTEGRFLDAMQEAIEGGQGALLATAMAQSFADDGHAAIAAEVHERAGESVAAVRERYDDARAAVDARNAELAVVQTTWSATLDEDARVSGMEAFLEHHADDYTEMDAAASILASTLEGASYGITPPAGLDASSETSAFTACFSRSRPRPHRGRVRGRGGRHGPEQRRPFLIPRGCRDRLDAAANIGNQVEALPGFGNPPASKVAPASTPL